MSESCFYHPDRETGRRCTRCGRPACPECLSTASVGSHCFQCVRDAAPPRREAVRQRIALAGPIVTQSLIAINLVAFVASLLSGARINSAGGTLLVRFGLFAPSIDIDGEWYRIFTSGFLHIGVIHLAFNMLLLYMLGQILESVMGRGSFTVAYFVALLGGSFGALLVSPRSLTVGASGAVFGLMGLAFVVVRNRGGNPFAGGIGGLGGLILINLFLTFSVSSISVGGHVGGLATGLLIGVVVTNPRRPLTLLQSYSFMVGLGVVLFIGSLWAATTWPNPIF